MFCVECELWTINAGHSVNWKLIFTIKPEPGIISNCISEIIHAQDISFCIFTLLFCDKHIFPSSDTLVPEVLSTEKKINHQPKRVTWMEFKQPRSFKIHKWKRLAENILWHFSLFKKWKNPKFSSRPNNKYYTRYII